jgi:hypothetical protein
MAAKLFPALALSLSFLLSLARSEDPSTVPYNQLVLDAVKTMPAGGGYSASAKATAALQRAFTSADSTLRIDSTQATPSYCSGATYLVFLKTLSVLQQHGLALSPTTIASLKPSGQPDGTGIWGRWNANGPGTACLFYEMGLGHNFTKLEEAKAGDFLKIFWNDGIGASEHGHSVIYIDKGEKDGVPTLTYWSSNIPGGFGTKTVPLSRIHRHLFSRLENPEAISGPLVPKSTYLSSLERNNSTPSEAAKKCGIPERSF